MSRVAVSVDVAAPAERTWAWAVDWAQQGRWIPLTTVEATSQQGRGVGAGVAAFTGIGRIGFLDTMVVTVWDPPRRCAVVHTGRVVRGTGVFEVVDLGAGRSRFLWSEDLRLPLGAVGRTAWPVLRPAAEAGVRRALAGFARLVESDAAPADA